MAHDAEHTQGGLSEILEPHESLRYIARLFKVLAVLLLLLLIAEVVLGLVRQGQAALPVLLVEATRLIVFSGVLWGLGDMALMFIESNHDLRATRVMVWQLNSMMKMRMDAEGLRVDLIRPGLELSDLEAADLAAEATAHGERESAAAETERRAAGDEGRAGRGAS